MTDPRCVDDLPEASDGGDGDGNDDGTAGPGPRSETGNPYVVASGPGNFGKRRVSGGDRVPKAHVAICAGDPPDWTPGEPVATTALSRDSLRFTRHVAAAGASDERVISITKVAEFEQTPGVRLSKADVEHLDVENGDYIRAYNRDDGRGGWDIVATVADADRDPLVPPQPLRVDPLPPVERADEVAGAESASRGVDAEADTSSETAGRGHGVKRPDGSRDSERTTSGTAGGAEGGPPLDGPLSWADLRDAGSEDAGRDEQATRDAPDVQGGGRA